MPIPERPMDPADKFVIRQLQHQVEALAKEKKELKQEINDLVMENYEQRKLFKRGA